MHDRFFLMAILASNWPLFLEASAKQASEGKRPSQLIHIGKNVTCAAKITKVADFSGFPYMRHTASFIGAACTLLGVQ
jgi:hypothetical protein